MQLLLQWARLVCAHYAIEVCSFKFFSGFMQSLFFNFQKSIIVSVKLL
jgi:hypothetical protein